jgi:hypothetical protein
MAYSAEQYQKNGFPDTFVYLTNYGHRNVLNIANTIETNIIKSKRQGTVIISDLSFNNTDEVNIIKAAVIMARDRV